MINFHEFAVLAALATWPDLGFPTDEVAGVSAGFCKGDPRGTTSLEDCDKALLEITNKGWAASGNGYTVITATGMQLMIDNGYLDANSWREHKFESSVGCNN